jgi:hypothetical protein
MRGKVIYRENADYKCPSCDGDGLRLLWTFPTGTTRTAIREMSTEQKNKKCDALKEHCDKCGYYSLR